jgi:hypothetical protein
MNYPAMRWAVEDCQLDGAAKPILFVIAYHADRDTGLCWAGQRRIAREAGVTRTHVQRVMSRLVHDGILEVVEQGSGTAPRIVRIAPAWVEGEASASGMVEGEATASGIVEGEVIHSPSSSGHLMWPQGSEHDELVATLLRGSGHMRAPEADLVATSGEASGHIARQAKNAVTSAKAGMSESQGYKQGFELQDQKQVLDNASSAADAAGVVEAQEPPPSVLANLEQRGLRPQPQPAPKPEQQPRSREEQLAYLKRIAAEDEAKAKSGQEGKEPA